ATEILLTGAEYSGSDLQRRVGTVLVAEQSDVLSGAINVASYWTSLPRTTLASWKQRVVTPLEEMTQKLPAEPLEPQLTALSRIALSSRVVSATAHPDGIVVVTIADRE